MWFSAMFAVIIGEIERSVFDCVSARVLRSGRHDLLTLVCLFDASVASFGLPLPFCSVELCSSCTDSICIVRCSNLPN